MPALTALRYSGGMRPLAKRLARRALERVPGRRVRWRGPATGRRVALTFDDGPEDLTPAYLDVLAAHGARATFFVTGVKLEARPDLAAAYRAGGHQLASHGYMHQRFTKMSPARLVDELTRTRRLLGDGPLARWVRPPHGTLGPLDLAIMLATGHTVAMWSLDSRDYDGAPADVITARCAPDRVVPGDVILFHEGQPQTLDALPAVITALHGAGYELVTMAELFGD